MRKLLLVAPLLLAACNQNTSPGADREAEVDPPVVAAPQLPAAVALDGIATEAIAVETMTEADIAALGAGAGNCRIVLTEVAFPSLVYQDGVRATIKLNGKLITLPSTGVASYADGGLTVSVREIPGEGNAGLSEAEMVVVFPGAADEHGFHGYRRCEEGQFG